MQKPWEIDQTIYLSEDALLEGLRRHDRMACTCLLKRFMPRLYRLALQLTASADDAEDVLQESFIQACGRIDRFEGRSSLGSWLHRIVVNTALMRLRRRVPETVSLVEEYSQDGQPPALEVVEALADWEGEPSGQVLSKELRDLIDEAIMALPETLRAAVVLRDVEGLSTSEAAASLRISEAALKVRLHRARLALRVALAPYIEER
ncbi:MAG: sigma-70 family RNA polymerase sigma factor [Chloroflexota bacterium]|nr:sigma-70 family RNA polymerase sigma factor [Chloroflexota bacterium]